MTNRTGWNSMTNYCYCMESIFSCRYTIYMINHLRTCMMIIRCHAMNSLHSCWKCNRYEYLILYMKNLGKKSSRTICLKKTYQRNYSSYQSPKKLKKTCTYSSHLIPFRRFYSLRRMNVKNHVCKILLGKYLCRNTLIYCSYVFWLFAYLIVSLRHFLSPSSNIRMMSTK